MSGHPEPTQNALQPAPPAQEFPYKRRCKNCPKFYTMTERTPKTKEFCCTKCRVQWHQFGSSFGKVREVTEKYIRAETKDQVRKQFAELIKEKAFRKLIADHGFIHRSQVKPANLTARVAEIEKQLQCMAQEALHTDRFPD